MIKDLIFDLDDTLVKTNRHYINTEHFFVNLFTDFSNINKNEILEMIKEEDMKLIKSHKYGYHWYRDGLIEVYKRLCEKYNIQIENLVMKLNNKVEEEFLAEPELWDNALKVIEHFHRQNYDLYIMTLGEYDVQMPKIEKAGIKKFFKKIFIVSRKDDKDYADMISHAGLIPSRSYFIGNSIYSDIIPAKRAGFNCVLFDKFTTFYNIKIEIPENVTIIKDLNELIEIIK